MTTWPEFGSSGDGVSLRELIERHGALNPQSALLVLRESLLSLAAAHEYEIVHQDYQPENVLLGREGSSELTGFDLPGLSSSPDNAVKMLTLGFSLAERIVDGRTCAQRRSNSARARRSPAAAGESSWPGCACANTLTTMST